MVVGRSNEQCKIFGATGASTMFPDTLNERPKLFSVYKKTIYFNKNNRIFLFV